MSGGICVPKQALTHSATCMGSATVSLYMLFWLPRNTFHLPSTWLAFPGSAQPVNLSCSSRLNEGPFTLFSAASTCGSSWHPLLGPWGQGLSCVPFSVLCTQCGPWHTSLNGGEGTEEFHLGEVSGANLKASSALLVGSRAPGWVSPSSMCAGPAQECSR